ncbi:MAG: 30S ribosomal protein S20 [Rhodospirillales bacterium]|nr:30S ribosomal protein S20 [Rhodospirillales bacterium]QQS10566.1 MAG: 30S ribosomal protein S20 [Rhodospirillales bacterium]
MANHKSAEKRARQTERRTAVNQSRRSRVRTFVRKAEEALKSGDKAAAQVAVREAESELARGAGKGVMHRNTTARKTSRLAARLNAMT